VSAAEKGDISLMAICIGSGETTENGVKIGLSFSDVKRLFEWGFENFSYREVIRPTEIVGEAPILIGSEESVVSVRPENAISVLLANDDDMKEFQQEITFYSERDGKPLSAPVMIGEVLGEIVLLYGGEPYASAKLVAAASVELPKLTFLKSSILAAWRSDPVQTVFWIVIIAAAVYIILVMRYKILRIRHRQNVRRARLARESGVLGTPGGAVGTTGGQAYSPEPEKNREYYQDSDETDVFKEIDSFTPLQSANGDPEENPEADLDFFENFFNKKQ
jgi:D-alanyl-D-alanine carboxypeptidase (penicillin-binding protein 5/6)